MMGVSMIFYKLIIHCGGHTFIRTHRSRAEQQETINAWAKAAYDRSDNFVFEVPTAGDPWNLRLGDISAMYIEPMTDKEVQEPQK